MRPDREGGGEPSPASRIAETRALWNRRFRDAWSVMRESRDRVREAGRTPAAACRVGRPPPVVRAGGLAGRVRRARRRTPPAKSRRRRFETSSRIVSMSIPPVPSPTRRSSLTTKPRWPRSTARLTAILAMEDKGAGGRRGERAPAPANGSPSGPKAAPCSGHMSSQQAVVERKWRTAGHGGGLPQDPGLAGPGRRAPRSMPG